MNRNIAKTLPTSVGYIYVLQSGGRVKIGKSKTPDERIRTLRNTTGFQVDCSHISHLHEGYSDSETKLHHHFAAYRTLGEWFEAPFQDVVAIAKEMVSEEIALDRLIALKQEQEESSAQRFAMFKSILMSPLPGQSNETEIIDSDGPHDLVDITAGDIVHMVVHGWISPDHVVHTAEEISKWKF